MSRKELKEIITFILLRFSFFPSFFSLTSNFSSFYVAAGKEGKKEGSKN